MIHDQQSSLPFMSLFRMIRLYYDRSLAEHSIGWGQHYYLCEICDNPGITPQALTELARADKGTTAKALHRLRDEGYITVATDENDRRVHHLFASPRAAPVAERISQLHTELHRVITDDIPEEDLQKLRSCIEKMSENISKFLDQP